MLTDKAMFDIVILTDHRYVNPERAEEISKIIPSK